MLNVTNTYGSNSTSQVINVLTCTPPTASFSVPTGTICQKVAVTFSNTSSGAPTPTYTWSTSPAANVTISPNANATNASITFSNPGTYSITLWASNASGTAMVTQTINVSNCAPNAGFNIPPAGCINAGITMSNTSTGATSYSWSASPTPGNISNVSAPNPTITFANAGTYTVTLKANNVSGSTIVTQTISISTCVGLNENGIATAIAVFPNPAKDVLNIEVANTDNYAVTVTNLLGKVILSEKSSKEKMNLNLSGVASGVYFLTIDAKGQKTTKKIIVE
jgi:PKD repeat protein